MASAARPLFFGRLTDRLGRKKLFVLSLAVYLIGAALGAVANVSFLNTHSNCAAR